MTALRSALFVVLLITWMLVMGILYLPLLVMPRNAANWAARFWLRGAFLMLRVICALRFEIRGTVPSGAALVASKHQSTFETFAFRLLLSDPAVILKKELLRIPIFGWYLWKTGVIAIDRSAGTKALKAMVKGAETAKAENRQVLIFPEGHRMAIGEAPNYHTGVAMLYGSLGLPCVPVAINSGLFWGRGGLSKRAGTVIVEFLPAIEPGLDRKKFMVELQARIEAGTAALVDEARAKFPHLPQ
ncbi:MAG: 1-acyl-sn-glycerol-3-phosphate acyltransferase [Rhodospirillaceae bacterium]|nr:1-acyl-sn-glycerol-3-phosphate acyltransferase [Rhodospirillales bacterium]